MGLFDSIRNAVGGSPDGESDESALRDSTTLDPTDFRERAQRVAERDGLDYSRESLSHLDTLVGSLEDPATADDATTATTYAEPTVQYGSYLGAVLVSAYDGTWTRDGGWGVTVAGPDDEVTVAVFEVAVRSLERDPVFAAVADRLDADLALDSADTTDSDEAVSEGTESDPADGTAVAEEAAGDPADSTEPTEASPADLIGEAEPDAESGEPSPADPESDEPSASDSDPTEPVAPPAPPEETDGETAGAPDPTAGDGLRAEYAETAREFAAFWSERDLDFAPGSLSRLDALVDAEWDGGRFSDATFGADEEFDDRAFTSVATELGSYFGEVLVRALDGEWTDETDHVAAVVVPTESGPLAVPVFQVARNSLRQAAVFERSYDALLDDIGQDSSAP